MSFQIRNSCPGQGNKNYIRDISGGWNTCITGSPTHPYCNVLANCVGYASGRFNEILNNARNSSGCTYKYLNCNAENFIERAQQAGLSIGSTPKRGSIMCWQKGASLNGNDGAGHVAIVEEVYDNNHVYTSESGYGSSYFWNSHRYNSNGRWGIGAGYTFRGFIYLPNDVQRAIDSTPAPTPGLSSKFNIGDEVIINGPLYTSSNASSPSGNVSNRKTKITRKVQGAAHPYNTTGDLGWMDESSITAVNPTPAPNPSPNVERKGLDISNYQAGINFDAIKNSEYSQFLILRGGYTGWGTGVSYNKDASFETFYSQAKSRGIPVGCYWYSCANTYDKGVAEANFLYENCLRGKQFEYPIYIDVEDEHHQVGNKPGVTAAIKGFCETLENKKYYVGIYGSDLSTFQEKVNIDELKDYDKWVARYGSSPKYVTSYGVWQTSSTGRINGYGDVLDTDIANRDYPTIIKNAKLNGFDGSTPTPTPVPPTPTPSYKYNIGDSVVLNGPIYSSSDASSPANNIKNKHTKITRLAKGAKHPYNTTGDLGWCDESSLSKDSGSSELKVGDTVKIIASGNANSVGTGKRAGGIGWTRKILRVYSGRSYPYQVGDSSGTTGFYKANALQKL